MVTKNPPRTNQEIFAQSMVSEPKTKQKTAETTTRVDNLGLPNSA